MAMFGSMGRATRVMLVAAGAVVVLCVCSMVFLHTSPSVMAPTLLLARARVPVVYGRKEHSRKAVLSRLKRISLLKQDQERLKSHLSRRDGRMLISLAGQAGEAGGNEGARHWGDWRTPENSNMYEGMHEPVHNNNPLGDHIISRDLDKDVNISQVGKVDNPIIDALEGKGLPKMFYEDDLFAPCEGEDCKIVKPSVPVSKVHTHWTGNPRGFGYGTGKQRDLYIRCSDPTSIYYNEACDPSKNHYGRPLRPGGFPDDNQVVDRDLWAKSKISPNSYAVRWFPFRHNLSASSMDFRPRGLKIPGNSGMMKTPYTGTGYYGGLIGPPFFTQGPAGSERSPVDHTPRPYLKFSSWTPEQWERIGLGDDAVPAQPLVGHEQGVNDQMYRFRYVNMDRDVFQKKEKNETAEGKNETAEETPAGEGPAAAKQRELVGLRQTAESRGRGGRSGEPAEASLHPLSLLPLLSPTLPPVAQLGLEGSLARLAQGELKGRLQHGVLAKAQKYLNRARRDLERAKEDEDEDGEEESAASAEGDESEAEGAAGDGSEQDQRPKEAADEGAAAGERGADGSSELGDGQRGARVRRGEAVHRSGAGHDAVPSDAARETVPIEKVMGAIQSVFGGSAGRARAQLEGTKQKLEGTKRKLEDTGAEVARMEKEMSEWHRDVSEGKAAAAYDKLPQAVMSKEGEKRLLAAALGHPLPPEPTWARGLKPSGLDGVAVRSSVRSRAGLVGVLDGVFGDKVTGAR